MISEHTLLEYAPQIRVFCFFSILIGMMLWEFKRPRRPLSITRRKRWPHNIGLVVFNTLALKLFFPVAALGLAISLEASNQGVFNKLEIPLVVEIILSILLLDLLIYGQHVLFHKVPILWRLHCVHHADKDYDVTTGSRFHTIEIMLSMLIKMAFIWLLGVPPVAVLIFEIILNGMAMFNHSNIKLAFKFDKTLRFMVVTPDMHRVHHSMIREEMNSNYGFNLSIWDRIFKTYIPQPRLGHTNMDIGLSRSLTDTQTNSLWGMLALPFRKS